MTNLGQVDAAILVGGLGMRLRSIIADVPKPMAPVAGRPFLEWMLLQLASQGVRRVILCIGYGAEHVRDYFGSGERVALELTYSQETDLRGTGGALKLAERRIASNPFLVLNGDSLIDCDLLSLLDTHQEAGAQATLLLTHVPDGDRFGNVVLGKGGEILGFSEKAEETTGLINAGVYVFDQCVLKHIPAGVPYSLELDLFPSLVGQGLKGLASDGTFIDIGLPEAYLQAETTLANTLQRLMKWADGRKRRLD